MVYILIYLSLPGLPGTQTETPFSQQCHARGITTLEHLVRRHSVHGIALLPTRTALLNFSMRSLWRKPETYKEGGDGHFWTKKMTNPLYDKPKKKTRHYGVCGHFVARSVLCVLVFVGLVVICHSRPEPLSALRHGDLLRSHRASREVRGIANLNDTNQG